MTDSETETNPKDPSDPKSGPAAPAKGGPPAKGAPPAAGAPKVLDKIVDKGTLDRCGRVMAQAGPVDKEHAEQLYAAYGLATGGRSVVTGDPLPKFLSLPVAAQAGWVSVALHSRFGLDGVNARNRILNPAPIETPKKPS